MVISVAEMPSSTVLGSQIWQSKCDYVKNTVWEELFKWIFNSKAEGNTVFTTHKYSFWPQNTVFKLEKYSLANFRNKLSSTLLCDILQ